MTRESAGEGFEQRLLFSYAMATPGKPDRMGAESAEFSPA